MEGILETIRAYFVPFRLEYLIEILIIYLIIYTFLRFMEGTRGEGILKGIALLILTVPILVTIVADRFNVLDRLLVIVKFFGAAAIPVLVIIVQPELRRALVRLGQTRIFGIFLRGETEGMVDEIVKAAFRMSRRKVGALVAIEREVGLQNYVERGTRLDAVVSSELLCTVFFPGSDLHDGAVVIQKDRVAAAGCLFPLSESPIVGSVLGTRHRAALGITEETDAVVVVVSEETGVVSFVHGGKMQRSLNTDQLRSLLRKYYAQLEHEEPLVDAVEKDTTDVAGGRGVS
ncbi:MAG TPA: diadenylate cyclase CdaA [Planctomycetota bacterium]|nr:diadenylate cyclase CdaA [Planctomycetota bacterium]